MAKYYGKIGFIMQQERIVDSTHTGIWEDTAVEQHYYGDVLQANNRWQNVQDRANDDLVISNRISILADTFATSNYQCMKYAEFMGKLWKITSIEVQYPRLVLTLGGAYNGQQASTAN